jgi:2-keto-4-pentenoate hydratase/2-oxohepta-3-ene-1,7-dioic acid hydratase in catechol pathway
MKLVNFFDDRGVVRLGFVTPTGVVDTQALPPRIGNSEFPQTTDELIGRSDILQSLTDFVRTADPTNIATTSERTLRFAPCLVKPEKIVCVGLNYRKHAIESGLTIPSKPLIFSKFNNSLAGHRQVIPLLPDATNYDYEVELGVVIGRHARNVSRQDALSYVFGYCTANDFSARDLQMSTSQWLIGKTPDAFLPLGPYLVTADEVRDPQMLGLRTWVNGELRQDSCTSDMIFPVAELISYLSRYMTLRPGDVISTGTPEGVILGMKVPKWLRAGDTVTVEVEKLGQLTNELVTSG